jgi:hypothetical protein
MRTFPCQCPPRRDAALCSAAFMSTPPACAQCHSDVIHDDGDHDIDCRLDSFGAMKLKSEFVKQA